MIIQNQLATAVFIEDVFSTATSVGLMLAPNATVVIFNSVAAGSKSVTKLIAAGVLKNLGTEEPGGTCANITGIKGDAGPEKLFGFTVDCADGVVSGATATFSIPGLLATDSIISIANKFQGVTGRNNSTSIVAVVGYQAQGDGTLTVVFVDAVPTSGSLTIAVIRGEY